MKALHLICRLNPETNRGFGVDAYDKKDPPSWVRNDAKNIFTSGFWVCGTSEATELVGGRLHLHENKAEKSWLSGKVIDVLLINMDFPGRWFVDERDESNDWQPAKIRDRIVFKVEVTASTRVPTAWRGAKHKLAFSSGVIDE